MKRKNRKNEKTVWLVGIAAVFVLLLVYVAYDLYLRTGGEICGDGRIRIDMREFTTQYSVYAVEFEASLGDKGKVSGKLNPTVLQQVSESIQTLNEFRKGLVAGYNACAIDKEALGDYLVRFQALDSLSRQINVLLEKSQLSESETSQLQGLTQQFIEQSRKVGEK